jgi:hypothetical protein
MECHYQDVKCMCNIILDCTGAPAYCWLLCLMHVCLVLNLSYSDNIKTTPLQLALGTTNDISPLLYFTFYIRGAFHGIKRTPGQIGTYQK